MKKFFQLIFREFKLFSKNNVALLIFIGAPIVYSLLIGAVYKDAIVTNLPIVVVDLDDTPLSKNIIDALNDNQYLEVKEVIRTTGNLRDDIIKKGYYAVVTIPDRFEADIQQKRYPEVDADINASNLLTANYVTTGVQTTLAVINAGIEIETLKKKGIPPSIAEKQFESFKINVTRFFNPASNYLLFFYPGVLGTVMQQVFLLVLALSFSKETEDKSFGQVFNYSKSPFYILSAKTIFYWLVGMILWLPLIRISFSLFHVESISAQGSFYAITALFMLSLTFLGTMVSALFKTQLKATEVLMVIATPSFIISGQTWPLQQMPSWVQALADIIPLTHYLEAFRKMALMDADFSEILPEFKILLLLTIIFFVLSVVFVWIRIKRTQNIQKIPAETTI